MVIDSTYSALRRKVLALAPADVGVGASTPVLAAVVELPFPDATATLVATVDGAASLYFSSGGGMIGAGEHAEVAEKARALIRVAEQSATQLAVTAEAPTPSSAAVRFFVVGADGLRTATVREDVLTRGDHALSSFFAAGHGLITAMREHGG